MKIVEFNWKKVKKIFNQDDQVTVSFNEKDYAIIAAGTHLMFDPLSDCVIIVDKNHETYNLCPELVIRTTIDEAIQYIQENQ